MRTERERLQGQFAVRRWWREHVHDVRPFDRRELGETAVRVGNVKSLRQLPRFRLDAVDDADDGDVRKRLQSTDVIGADVSSADDPCTDTYVVPLPK